MKKYMLIHHALQAHSFVAAAISPQSLAAIC